MNEKEKELKYKEFYESYLRLEKKSHEKNQMKIKNGLKINIFLPLIFLSISFMTDSSKLVWLILWIVSLFGIAFYLMYVEYMDHNMRQQLEEFGIGTDDTLIGDRIENAESRINSTMEEIDERIEETKQMIAEKVSEGAEKIGQLAQKKKEDKDNE